jgi:hypothetical protein
MGESLKREAAYTYLFMKNMGESLKREAAYTYLFMSCCQQAMWVGVMVFHAVEIHYYLKSIGCNIRIWEQL